jgi:sugar phosphate isomerase/epimerase
MTTPFTRREFLAGATAAAAAGMAAGRSAAIEPFNRQHPRFTGLALTAYSLKPHMRWWWGKPAEGKLDMLDFLDYCGRLGLEGAELTSYFFQTPVEPSFLGELRRRAHLLGLDICSAAMGNDFSHPPGSDEARRQLEYTRTWIDHFADVGAPVVRVFASRNPPKEAGDEEILRNVQANLAEALPHAERRGVMLGMENHDFVKNIDYLLRIVRAVDSRWFGVIWDSANLAPTPDPYAELARIAPYALVAQIKVMTRVNGENVPADFARLVKMLREARYAGYLVFEYEEPEDAFQAIPPFLAQLRRLIEQAA